MAELEEVARELSLRPQQVAGTLALSEEGATVPFIARYRKEATGGLDEVQDTPWFVRRSGGPDQVRDTPWFVWQRGRAAGNQF